MEVKKSIDKSIRAIKSLREEDILEAADIVVSSIKNGGKLLLCGNGGSAADCQHISGELVGKFRYQRMALPAISLSADTSILTALANDFGADEIFRRQVEALGEKGDVLFALSTSGTSPNIISAVDEARKKGLKVVGFTGSKGSKLKSLCDVCIMAESEDTPYIQEAHAVAYHLICGIVEGACM
ncbi:MAG: SIS domain-containing protein [Candidatus Altiarchaeota archaeon]|nr:SIS domain-containing protein [Candidatus Altiarchaeota archaeon]